MRFRIGLLATLRRLPLNQRGSSAIELGFCLPLIAGMIVPMTDLGMGAYTQMQLQAATQAGAEYAAIKGFNGTNITTAVNSATALTGISFTNSSPSQSCSCITGTAVVAASPAGGPPCTQTCPNGTVGTFVNVSTQVTYNALFDYPGLGKSFTLTAQSNVRIK